MTKEKKMKVNCQVKTGVLIARIKKVSAAQKRLPIATPEWHKHTVQLRPLFRELVRRQKEDGAVVPAEWRAR